MKGIRTELYGIAIILFGFTFSIDNFLARLFGILGFTVTMVGYIIANNSE